jgi:hypothetical protein
VVDRWRESSATTATRTRLGSSFAQEPPPIDQGLGSIEVYAAPAANPR